MEHIWDAAQHEISGMKSAADKSAEMMRCSHFNAEQSLIGMFLHLVESTPQSTGAHFGRKSVPKATDITVLNTAVSAQWLHEHTQAPVKCNNRGLHLWAYRLSQRHICRGPQRFVKEILFNGC